MNADHDRVSPAAATDCDANTRATVLEGVLHSFGDREVQRLFDRLGQPSQLVALDCDREPSPLGGTPDRRDHTTAEKRAGVPPFENLSQLGQRRPELIREVCEELPGTSRVLDRDFAGEFGDEASADQLALNRVVQVALDPVSFFDGRLASRHVPFPLVRGRMRLGCSDLARQELQIGAPSSIDSPKPADPEHEDGRARQLSLGNDRHQGDRARYAADMSARELQVARRRSGDSASADTGQHARLLDSARRGHAHRPAVDAVDLGCQNVAVLVQCVDAPAPDVVDRPQATGSLPQEMKRPHATLTEHMACRFRRDEQHAFGAAALAEDRAVRPGEVRLFGGSPAAHEQRCILGPRRLACREDSRRASAPSTGHMSSSTTRAGWPSAAGCKPWSGTRSASL